MSPSKTPKSMSLEDFAQLGDAPVGKGGQQKKINWEEVLAEIQKRPMTNGNVFQLITGNKKKFMFDEEAVDPNKGTVWTQLKRWATSGSIRKAVDANGTIFYGPPRA